MSDKLKNPQLLSDMAGVTDSLNDFIILDYSRESDRHNEHVMEIDEWHLVEDLASDTLKNAQLRFQKAVFTEVDNVFLQFKLLKETINGIDAIKDFANEDEKMQYKVLLQNAYEKLIKSFKKGLTRFNEISLSKIVSPRQNG